MKQNIQDLTRTAQVALQGLMVELSMDRPDFEQVELLLTAYNTTRLRIMNMLVPGTGKNGGDLTVNDAPKLADAAHLRNIIDRRRVECQLRDL